MVVVRCSLDISVVEVVSCLWWNSIVLEKIAGLVLKNDIYFPTEFHRTREEEEFRFGNQELDNVDGTGELEH